jgi:hypothetical protein
MTQRASGTGMRLTWRWDIVGLGRFAGAFVLASAVGLAIWVFVQYGDYASLDHRILSLWQVFVSIAWGGVAIILLAELVDRLTDHGPRERG